MGEAVTPPPLFPGRGAARNAAPQIRGLCGVWILVLHRTTDVLRRTRQTAFCVDPLYGFRLSALRATGRPVQSTMALLCAARKSATERGLRPVSASKAPETMAR